MPSTRQGDDFVIADETGDVNLLIYFSGHLFYWLLFFHFLYIHQQFFSVILYVIQIQTK